MATMPRPMPGMGPGPPGPMGGPPSPLAGPLLQQAMAGTAGTMPGGDAAMALRSLQALPVPDNAEIAIRRAQDATGFAMQQVYQRSPEVAKELASALMNLKQAAQKYQALPRPDAMQPPMGLPLAGLLQGGPPPGPAPAPPSD